MAEDSLKVSDAVVAADALHLLWRPEPQRKPVKWTCSGCGFVAHEPMERYHHRLAAVLAAAAAEQ